MRLNTKQIALYTAGEIIVEPIDAAQILTGISWDSREIQPGWLYVALPGERTDGHNFVEAALRAGAGAALVEVPPVPEVCGLARELGAGVIQVDNTFGAITDLARAWRAHITGHVIGLTGSTGKTTTKNLVRDVCAAHTQTVATFANQNNELGVPRTLLNADPTCGACVVEMGMRGAGQITALCDFVRPQWGIITNVGESHIELLGSREAIARAKGELFDALPDGTGVIFMNAADSFAASVIAHARPHERGIKVVGYAGPGNVAEGSKGDIYDAAVWAENVALDEQGRPRFTLRAAGFPQLACEGSEQEVGLQLQGTHNVGNACAAAAVGLELGMQLPEIARALANSLPEAGRQEILHSPDGTTIINDAYNANPTSMRAALKTLCAMRTTGRRIAVLGDMGELGSFARACHEGVGQSAADLPIDALVCVGELAAHIAQGARAGGMSPERVTHVPTLADAFDLLEGTLAADDIVLVKASHFMELNKLAEGLAR